MTEPHLNLKLTRQEADWLMDLLHAGWATLTVQHAEAVCSRDKSFAIELRASLDVEQAIRERLRQTVIDARIEND